MRFNPLPTTVYRKLDSRHCHVNNKVYYKSQLILLHEFRIGNNQTSSKLIKDSIYLLVHSTYSSIKSVELELNTKIDKKRN